MDDQGNRIDKDKPLYVISVAAELVEMHPQTLRLYERKGQLKEAIASLTEAANLR